MQTQKQLAIFLSEFDDQLQVIENIYEDLKNKLQKIENQNTSKEAVESIGYWLHNLYCAFEDLFKIVSVFWENHIDANGKFHVSLLKRMRIEIKGVRPALIGEYSHICLNELRAFRHVFRHAYSYGLDDERVLCLLRKIIESQKKIYSDINDFRLKINELMEAD